MTAVPRRILCADDNVHVLSMLTATFQAKGFAVETAVDGAQALTQIEADPSRFDLLITDSRMPRVDGFGLVGAARGAGYQGRIVVFASGLAPEEKQRYLDLGVDCVVGKPDPRGELLAIVTRLSARG